MDMFNVTVERRLPQTKGMMRQLKRDGFVPGVIYSNADSMPIALNHDEVRSFLQHRGENQAMVIIFDGKPMLTKIKEVQRDPVTLDILHIDLMPAQPGILH